MPTGCKNRAMTDVIFSPLSHCECHTIWLSVLHLHLTCHLSFCHVSVVHLCPLKISLHTISHKLISNFLSYFKPGGVPHSCAKFHVCRHQLPQLLGNYNSYDDTLGDILAPASPGRLSSRIIQSSQCLGLSHS